MRTTPELTACQLNFTDDCPAGSVTVCFPDGVSISSCKSLAATTAWFLAFFSVTV
jgi:hypothetical protein